MKGTICVRAMKLAFIGVLLLMGIVLLGCPGY